MATKSILKNISIKDKKTASSFISALENAKGKKSINVIDTKKCIEASSEQMRKIFGSN